MVVDASPHSSVRRKLKGTITGLNLIDHHPHGGSASNHRQSLAFELAAAMEPEENDQASILDQLGLGDQDEFDDQVDQDLDPDHDLDDEPEYEDDEEEEQIDDHQSLRESNRLRSQHSRSTIGTIHSSIHNPSINLSSPRKSSIRELDLSTPTQTPRRKASRSTLNTADFSPRSTLAFRETDGLHDSNLNRYHPSQDAEDELDHSDGVARAFGSRRSDQGLDSDSEEDDGKVLEDGIKATAQFINLLKLSNTDCPVPSTVNDPTPASTTTAVEIKSDRQPVVERMITDIVRTMTDQVRDRESQIRELKEIEIALSRTDRRALAELEALPNVLDERDFRSSTILGKSFNPTDPSACTLPGTSQTSEELQSIETLDHQEQIDDDGLDPGRLTPTNLKSLTQTLEQIDLSPKISQSGIDADHSSTGRNEGNKPIENLGELKLITNSLIHSLNQIHEHTQISRQTQIEIVRKLKGVKGLVSIWKSDSDSIQHSIDFISQWEIDQLHGQHRLHLPRDVKVRGVFEAQVKLATTEVEKLLNDAFVDASSLLQPQSPSFPALINRSTPSV